MITHSTIDKALLIGRVPFPRDIWRQIDRITDKKRNRAVATFNPSILDYRGAKWMAYRAEGNPPSLLPVVCTVRLNDRWEPQYTSNKALDLWTRFGSVGAEDPRLVMCGPELYCFYNDGGRMWLARLDSETNVEMCEQIEAEFRLQPEEKNWSFFSTDGLKLRAVYQPCEALLHRVVKMEWTGHHPVVSFEAEEPWDPGWEFGDIRGGAPPVLHNGHYWHFFHSWTKEAPFDRRYHCGVYLFEPKPPFRPVAISDGPLFSASPQGVPKHMPFAVVFPGGAARTKSGWLLSYGEHDWECCYATIPDEDIKLKWFK